MLRGGPSPPHSSVPLSAALRRERDRENEGSLRYPIFVLSPSPSVPLTPLPPTSPNSLSLLPNPPHPLSMDLLNLPVYPPLSSLLPLPLHPSPFPLPSFPSLRPCEELGTHLFSLLLPFPFPLAPLFSSVIHEVIHRVEVIMAESCERVQGRLPDRDAARRCCAPWSRSKPHPSTSYGRGCIERVPVRAETFRRHPGLNSMSVTKNGGTGYKY